MMNNKQTKPNILFILIDSLRADKCSGENRTCKTPNLDKMIKNGVYFTHAISPSDASLVSLRSIFTGLLPFKTGTIKNKRVGSNMKANFPTMISILRNAGYQTIGKVPSLATFNSVYSEFEDDEKYSVDKQWPRLDDGIGLEIIKKIKIELKEPWFYYTHILDVHSKVNPKMPPLVIPEKFDNEQFGSSKYERAVSATDYWLGEILKNVDLEKTLVIVTADHGSFIPYFQNDVEISLEETPTTKLPNIKTPKFLNSLKSKAYTILRDNEEKSILAKLKNISITEYEKRNLLCIYDKKPFKVLYDDLVRVPLLFIGKNMPQGKIFDQQVSTQNILPTIIDILQLEENICTDGHSLCPIIEGKKIEEEPVFIQSSFPMEKEFGYLVGIRTSKYKYNRSIDNPEQNVFLYDLQKDPKEERNISNEQPKLIDEYENLLSSHLSQTQNEEEEIGEDEMKVIENELKRLGYI